MGIEATIKRGHRPEYVIIAIVALLVVFGLAMLASASSELGKIRFNDSYYYLKQQLLKGVLPGLLGFFLAFFTPYKAYKRFALPLLLMSLALLALVFTSFGYVAGGAGRWLSLGPLTFQPAEFLKVTYIIYLAAWLSNPRKSREKNLIEGFIPFLVVSGIVAGTLVFQPATSTVVILITSGMAVYFLSGAKWRYILVTIGVGLLALGILVLSTGYRRDRISSFWESERNLNDKGYHLREALITLGSGGLWGLGYGESLAKVRRLPASINDSIFAVIGSELGFVGAGALVALFGYLSIRILWIAKDFRERFGKFILVGFGSIIGLQAFFNMAAISGIIPLTGVPLPFISYGGTALTVFLVMSGIVANISKYT
ncbi:MAG: FtsW/RodA/SpoVE family cell cycle protein [Candidatus Liptonbacteria bacterium]|nr:FtsW/RodA/SpoVE family cell cycle protein [Candidatus Liptonbacteria bacterium]